jgi:hypothetical protein
MLSIEDLFQPMSTDEIISMLVDQRIVCCTGHSTKFASVFSIEEFWENLNSSSNIRAVFKDLLQAYIRPADVEDMFSAGATICVSGLERSVPKFHRLCESVKAVLGYTGALEIKCYYSPDGVGFAPHYDPRTVTTLQIAGSKKWSFGSAPSEFFPQRNSPYPLDKSLTQSLGDIGTSEVLLNPGDFLCLPPGTLHWAEASGSSLALNFSFEHIGDSAADEFCRRIRELLLQSPELRRVLFQPVREVSLNFNKKVLSRLADQAPWALAQTLEHMGRDYVK